MTTFSGKQPVPPVGTIENEAFWPDIVVNVFFINYRIPNDMVADTAREHLIQAMSDINFRLSEFKAENLAAGYQKLTEVPADEIASESILVALYRRAVCCRAKASICRDYPTIDRREPAENQAKSAPETETVYLRFADEAVRQMLCLTDITVEMI